MIEIRYAYQQTETLTAWWQNDKKRKKLIRVITKTVRQNTVIISATKTHHQKNNASLILIKRRASLIGSGQSLVHIASRRQSRCCRCPASWASRRRLTEILMSLSPTENLITLIDASICSQLAFNRCTVLARTCAWLSLTSYRGGAVAFMFSAVGNTEWHASRRRSQYNHTRKKVDHRQSRTTVSELFAAILT